MSRTNIKFLQMKNTGFSLVELVITLALAAVMLTVGVPAFNNVMENNALAGAANRFISGLTLARSEAITRNIEVEMCRLNADADGCATSGTWANGWLIWADTNDDNTLQDAEIISIDRGLDNGYSLVALNNQFTQTITFNPIGEARGNGGNQQEVFRLCDPDNDNDRTRLIYLSGVGNAWVNRKAGSTSPATECPT